MCLQFAYEFMATHFDRNRNYWNINWKFHGGTRLHQSDISPQ